MASRLVCLVTLVGTLFCALPARALDIVFHYADLPGDSALQDKIKACCEAAARQWESKFTDDIEVRVRLTFGYWQNRHTSSIITAKSTYWYTDVIAALRQNARNESGAHTERAALANQPDESVPVEDSGGPRQCNKIVMTTANAKALFESVTGTDPRYGPPLPDGLDGELWFCIDAAIYDYDYDRSNNIDADKADFTGLVLRGLGYILGFFSMTDLRDSNISSWPVGWLLEASPLDLWRFTETEPQSRHDLRTEARRIHDGPAEYYYGLYPCLPFARGLRCRSGCDDECNGKGADNWRCISSGRLMTSGLRRGDEINIHADDVHLLDFVGYETGEWVEPSSSCPYGCMRSVNMKWVPPGYVHGYVPPLPGFPPLPPPPTVSFPTNQGVVVGMDLNLPSPLFAQKRSGLGYAFFVQERTNHFGAFPGLPEQTNEVNVLPPRPWSPTLPAAFEQFYIISDRSNGVPFSARAMFSTSGAQYVPTIGPYGGYRMVLAIDSEGDGVTGDVDGTMVIELLADENRIPNPQTQNVFAISSNRIGNAFHAFDALALCLCEAGSPKTETEPNFASTNATDLGQVGFSTVVGSIAPVGDVDYYKFTAPTNTKAWITVDTGGVQSSSATTRNSYLRLLASDGISVIEEDDDDGSGNGCDDTTESGLASAIAGRTLPGGDFFVEVRDNGDNNVLSPYRLLLTITSGVIPAESEPNNTAATATPIVNPLAPTGVRSGFLTTNDMDYYAVTVSGGSLLHVSADSDPERNGASHNLIVDLITQNGSTLLYTANGSIGGQPDAPAEGFGFVVASNGTYYVRVREPAGQPGTYHLMVSACPITTLPLLQVTSVTTNACALSWAAAQAYGFRLQTSTDLISWADASCEIACADGLIHVSVPTNPGDLKRFFRLRGLFPPPP